MLDTEQITKAAQQAYVKGQRYRKLASAYGVFQAENKWPALREDGVPPTPERYNEWLEEKKRYHELDKTMRAPLVEAKEEFRGASRELYYLFPENVGEMRLTIEEGTFDVRINYMSNGHQAKFTKVAERS